MKKLVQLSAWVHLENLKWAKIVKKWHNMLFFELVMTIDGKQFAILSTIIQFKVISASQSTCDVINKAKLQYICFGMKQAI